MPAGTNIEGVGVKKLGALVLFLAFAYAVGKYNLMGGEPNKEESKEKAIATVDTTCTSPLRAGFLKSDGMWDSWRSNSNGRYRHHALDIFAPTGTPIYAVRGGEVQYAGARDPGGYGHVVYVRHADGTGALYAHNSSGEVRVGDRVAKGQLIAKVGSAGNASSRSPHLHLEIGNAGDKGHIVDGYRTVTDPKPWLKKCGGWNSQWD
jgi:murein DD-endopeptidase MepM/ murein hydrolase activator NlpD